MAEVDLHRLVREMAASRPDVDEFVTSLERVASARDRGVFLDVIWEDAGGSPCPSALVAEMHGLGHANVRKIRERVARRVERDLASAGERSSAA